MLIASTTKKIKKRKRINAPINNTNVDYRIKQIKTELNEGLTKFDAIWLSIQTQIKAINTNPSNQKK